MILTDREIQIALAQNQLSIDPSPDADAYSSTSIDLTLADTFAVWLDKPGMELSPGAPGYSYKAAAQGDIKEIDSARFWRAIKINIHLHRQLHFSAANIADYEDDAEE